MSSDRPSLSSVSCLTSPPPSVNPEPAYIAASAAAQIVTSKHQDHVRDWFDEVGTQPPSETALVSTASLSLVNSFLDHLLYNFLSTARSTSLSALRPAVSEVLRPRLATEAIAGADEELQEFLGGADDDEFVGLGDGAEADANRDTELTWKRTRLRCMVYTRLGDMEEDEEDMWVERDCLGEEHESLRHSSANTSVVSPAVAIFLTSILEFIGEHALMVAGEAAYGRMLKAAKDPTQSVHLSSGAGRLVVEELDMEKVAFNTTLGRLWRTWRKRIRSPMSIGSRSFSRDLALQRTHSGPLSSSTSRKSSVGAPDEVTTRSLPTPVAERPQVVDPASIPLPMTENDIQEIERPPSASQGQGQPESVRRRTSEVKKRPRSMLVFPSSLMDPQPSEAPGPISLSSPPQSGPSPWRLAPAPPPRRKRSSSLPSGKQVRKAPITDSAPSTSKTVYECEPSFDEEMEGNAFADSEEPELLSRIDTNQDCSGLEDEEPQILKSTRISMETAQSPIEVVQTRSRAASSTRSLRVSSSSQAKDRHSQDLSRTVTGVSPTPSPRGAVDMANSPDVYTDSDGSASSPGSNRVSESPAGLDEDVRHLGKQRVASPATAEHSVTAGHVRSADDNVTQNMYTATAPGPSDTSEAKHCASACRSPEKEPQQEGLLTTASRDSPPSSIYRSVPALAPLEELTEDIQDGADEGVSPLPSPSERDSTSSTELPRGSHRRQRSHDYPAVSPVRPTAPSKAQGPTVASSLPRPHTPRLRRSGSSGREKQPILLSTSRPATATGASSEMAASMTSEKHPKTASRHDDKQRSFEQLIRSDETLQYTLTPQTVRDVDVR